MHSLKTKYSNKKLNFNLFICLFFVLFSLYPLKCQAQAIIGFRSSETEEDILNSSDDILIVEPIIQSFNMQDYAYTYYDNGIYYISIPQMSAYLGIKYSIQKDLVELAYTNDDNNKYIINFKERQVFLNDDKLFEIRRIDWIIKENTLFLSSSFWEKLLKAEIEVDALNMLLVIERDEDFPTITKLKAKNNRIRQGYYKFDKDSFSDYEHDNRLFGAPVIDLSLGKGWSRHRKTDTTINNDNYSVNLAMIAAGLDVNAYMSGDSYNDRKPVFRLSGSRTFLDEPTNALNLKKLKVGDISGLSESYFTNSGYGRGISVSSFKNLVMSADKTISLTGPLTPGWEVELYWNNQLIGYRQGGTNGEYNFPNIPVSFGLNTFKLVFYGPYGETRTEIKRYYSGTSPVKTGEFGYNISVYQPNKYLFEDNRSYEYEGNDVPVIDMNYYYGATDNLTLMGGFTQTPDVQDTFETQYFGMAGAQISLSGSSIQYNIEQNLDTSRLGHHLEWQGDVYIGNVYLGLDKYNQIHSPISFYNDEYLDEQVEARLSGILPFNMPYYLSYRKGKLESGKETFENITARVSKQVPNGFSLTVEDNYYKYGNNDKPYNTIKTGVYKWMGKYSAQGWLTYKTNPNPEFTEFQAIFDWRSYRNTYISNRWRRDIENDMDYFSISAGHVFDFGGLTATIETDRDLNVSAYLTYSISFAKEPDKMGIITNANSKLSNTGTMYVNVFDENGNPVPDVALNANGLEKEVYTNKYGSAVLADLQTYEKVALSVDMETVPDISLQPEYSIKKVVLRPGTIKTVNLKFIHRGAVEGVLENPQKEKMFGYKIAAINNDGDEIASTFADVDGYFILDGVPYGSYEIVVSRDGKILSELNNVKIDDVAVYIENQININEDYGQFYKEFEPEYETIDEDDVETHIVDAIETINAYNDYEENDAEDKIERQLKEEAKFTAEAHDIKEDKILKQSKEFNKIKNDKIVENKEIQSNKNAVMTISVISFCNKYILNTVVLLLLSASLIFYLFKRK